MIYLFAVYVVCTLFSLANVGYVLYNDRKQSMDLSTFLAIVFIVILSHVPVANFVLTLFWIGYWYNESGVGKTVIFKGMK